ncbi:Rieske (2Fe-2S) protein [Nubsella zeaxanthinifaciens]|uniref:Rieske (2Fe-2S) protein n=1 Tax=Nubsella zeaxanthinifaciens TaxID=392412 RepID=UPI003D0930B1
MKRIAGILSLFLLFTACGKQENFVPDFPVNFSAPLTDPNISRLSTPGGAVSFNNYGVAGIIIYRRADNQYVAYDRCSTVNPEQKNAVVLDDPALTATDPVSGAKYSLYDGSPVKAPAKTSLKRYNAYVAGNTLYVKN